MTMASTYVTLGKRRTQARTPLLMGSRLCRSAIDSSSIRRKATSEKAVAISDRTASGLKFNSS